MNRFISQKFRFYSFVCIALLVFVHGYNLEDGYLQPFTLVEEPLTFTTFIEYLLANGILRFRIPMLFIISGYIMALQDRKPYRQMAKRRFQTLMVPYFIWSAVGLLLTFIWQQVPVLAEAVYAAQVDQLGDNRAYSAIGWKGILFRWIVVPISFQLWFIRSLFIYNLLYPVFRWCIHRYPRAWFGGMFLLWILQFNFIFVESQGLLFFSLGIWLSKSAYPLHRQPEWFSYYLAWLFFIGLGVIRTFMAFELEASHFTTWLMILMYAGMVIAGLLAVWFGADPVVKWCMQRPWFLWISAFSFIIYGLHVPLIQYITMLMYHYLHALPNYRILVYVLAPLSTLVICILAGALLRKAVPGFYRLATGGRGF
jgi:fucose 4-O-acetylase-like acetyltransferase